MRDWRVGDLIDSRWRILRIHPGGMGTVYVVYDPETATPTAVKTLRRDIVARDPIIESRFELEVRAWFDVGAHENLVEAHFVHKAEGRLLLFVEYVAGGDLSRWIANSRMRVDMRSVLRFALNFCDGMQHAHDRGLIAHRDIKPSNCLITDDDRLKVTDFGLAKLKADIAQLHVGHAQSDKFPGQIGQLTATGATMGTPEYMAPEQFSDSRDVDFRADMYSFGVMLFEMLTGRRPYHSPDRTHYRHLHETAPIPSLLDHMPPQRGVADLNSITHTCLRKASTNRFQSFASLRDALADVYQHLTGEMAPRPATGAALDARRLSNRVGAMNELECYEDALVISEHALDVAGGLSQFWNNRANSFRGLSRLPEAIACYRKAIELAEGNGLAWANLGVAYRQLGKVEDALVCYEAALRFDPRNERTLLNKAAALMASGQFAPALKVLDDALAINPHLASAWFNTSSALYHLGKHREALTACDTYLSFVATDPQAWYQKGKILESIDRIDDALEAYQRGYELDPTFEDLLFAKGAILFRREELEAAAECFRRVMEQDPDRIEAVVNLGFVKIAQGLYREAIGLLDRVLRHDAEDARAQLGMGISLCVGLEQHRDALPHLEAAYALGNRDALPYIQTCREALGRR